MQATPQDIIAQILKKQAEWLSDFYRKVAEGGIPQHNEYSTTTASCNWVDDVDYGPDFTSDQEAWRVRHPKKELWVSEDTEHIAKSQTQADDMARILKMKFIRYVEHIDEVLILEPVEEYNGVLIHQDPSGDLYFFDRTGGAHLYDNTQSKCLKVDIDYFIKKNLI
jgi:hypothetical protein